jgi:hypothetical protein
MLWWQLVWCLLTLPAVGAVGTPAQANFVVLYKCCGSNLYWLLAVGAVGAVGTPVNAGEIFVLVHSLVTANADPGVAMSCMR